MSRVYWDSMIFIYWLENEPAWSPKVERVWNGMLRRGDELCASYLSVGEVLAGPVKRNRLAAAARAGSFFDEIPVTYLPFDRKAATVFASLRAVNLRLADAYHLSAAASAGVDLFLTNDLALHKLHIPGIQFIAGLDTNLF